jgi:hypothetical protein
MQQELSGLQMLQVSWQAPPTPAASNACRLRVRDGTGRRCALLHLAALVSDITAWPRPGCEGNKLVDA